MKANSVRYSLEVAKEFITRLAAGETELSICEGDHMPERSTIYLWRIKYPDFNAAYERACEMSADAMAADSLYIADHDRDPQRARNRIMSRQWLAGKRNRMKYGEKVDITVNERPSLRQAIEHAAGNITGPVRDQLAYQDEQVIDLIEQFFGEPSDYESSVPVLPVIDPDDDVFK